MIKDYTKHWKAAAKICRGELTIRKQKYKKGNITQSSQECVSG